MSAKILRFVSESGRLLPALYRLATKLTIVIILFAILFVSCVQIIDRGRFYKLVKIVAIEEAKKGDINTEKDSMICVIASNGVDKKCVSAEMGSKTLLPNTNTYNLSQQNDYSRDNSSLDILSKSDGLINANGLTFCVTLIVALLATLLLYRIETMDKLVEENRVLVDENKKFQKEIKSYNIHTIRFNNILTRLESAYDITILIENMTAMLSSTRSDDKKNEILKNIANLCNRFSLICSDITTYLNERENKIDFLIEDEKNILSSYFENAIGELRRSWSSIKRIKNEDLQSIIMTNIRSIEIIREDLGTI